MAKIKLINTLSMIYILPKIEIVLVKVCASSIV